MPIKRLPLLLTAFCLLLTVSVARAQSSTATLSGTIEDEKGALIPGAAIAVVNEATSFKRTTTTNDSGSFTIPLLPPGEYTVLVEREGFTRVQLTNIVLNVGDQKAVQVQLKVGDVASTVEVRADATLLRTDGSVGTVVDRQFVENIPLNGRSFQSLITLTPGVVLTPGSTNFSGQFSVNGQRASGNAFMVDGVSANFATAPGFGAGNQTSGNLPGLTSFGTTQSLVSVDALQEFKIETSTYSAEYGRQPGGQISIATRSGTNDFHGSLFDYIRNDVFDANDWFANRSGQPKPPLRQNDFGGTFSGPIILPNVGDGGPRWYDGRDQTFFFFSYEGLRLRLPKFAFTNVPSLCLRGQGGCPTGQTPGAAAVQPVLNAFPLPNGRDLPNGLAEFSASYSDPSTLDATSIRIDHSLGGKLAMFGRYNHAPSRSTTRSDNNLNLLSSRFIKTRTLTLGLTASVSSTVSNELRANLSDNQGVSSLEQDTFGGAVPVDRNVLILSQYDSSSAQGNAQFPFSGRSCVCTPLVDFVDANVNSQRQFNVVDNISYSVGSHQFKFGADYRRLTPIINVNSYQIIPQFSSAQQVRNATAGSGTIQAGLPSKPIYTNFSAYAHDTWKVSRRLLLNIGVRWELNPAPSEEDGNMPLAVTQVDDLRSMQLAPRGTKLWNTAYNNFAPRFGVSYQLRQHPGFETIVRGGFGIFYDTGNDTSGSQFSAFPFVASRPAPNIQFPLNPSQVAPPVIPALQSSFSTPLPLLHVFDPELKLPYTLQWNLTGEQSLGNEQSITLAYIGAAGRRLLQRRRLVLPSSVNPVFPNLFLTANGATSEYNAFQAQFQRRLSRGLQALVSYTWSHAIDEDSTSSTGRIAQRGNADFDVRHVLAAALTYDIPMPAKNTFLRAVFGDWSIDTRIHAQSAFPVDVIAATPIDPVTGDLINVRPNLVLGVPLYIEDPNSPGGRRINKSAFSIPTAGQSGNLGRNVVRGLAIKQIDLAVRRQFEIREKLHLQFRVEAFNVLNNPNFGAIQTNLSTAEPPTGNFGEATNMLNRQLGGISQLYQVGGPRSLQFAFRILF